MRSLRLFVAALLSLSLAAAARAEDKQTDPRRGFIARQFILPAPDNVKIDGDLAEWDLSGSVESFTSFHERDTRNGRLAMMYDAEALYIGARVTDQTPLMNRHDPEANPDKVWNGDSCQVRLVIDRQHGYPIALSKFKNGKPGDQAVMHLLLWYYTDGKRPGLQLRRDMDYQLPKQWGEHGMVTEKGFTAAYRAWDDGKGYTFEYRVPWTTLEAPAPPRAGDVVAGTTQFNWSRPDGLSIDKGGYARNVVSSGGFPFQTTDCWGKFIFAESGKLPAEVAATTAHEVGAQDVPTPLELRVQVPKKGQVSLGIYDDQQVLRRQLLAEDSRAKGPQTLAWDGLDFQGQPLAAGNYRARGMVSDPITEHFVLSVHNAGQPPYKTDDGTGGWGADHGQPTTVAAAGDKMLLAWSVAESGWGIIRTDLSGQKEWGTKHPAEHLAAWGERFFAAGGHGNKSGGYVRVYEVANARPVTFAGGASDVAVPEAAKGVHTTGLAVSGDQLYVAHGAANLVGVYDAASGQLQKTIEVAAPGALATGPQSRVFALSQGSSVLRLTPEPTVIREGLADLRGLSVDAEGRLFVTRGGKDQDVLVIEGDRTRTIGIAGGRPRRGRFAPQGLLEPGGCAVDAKGRLWVAELLDGPKRISVWDTATGKLAMDFFGASSYFGWAWIDPQNPQEAFCHNCIFEIDLEKRTKKLVATHWRRNDPNEPPPHNPGGHAGHFRVITADNGAQVGWGMAGKSRASVAYLRDGDLMKPVFGQVDRGYPALAEHWEKLDAKWTKARIRPHQRPRKLFWQDLDDDQQVEPEEVAEMDFFVSWITPDLTLWSEHGAKLEPVRFAGKKPIYDIAKVTPIAPKGKQHNAGGMAMIDPAEGIYTLNPGSEHAFAKWHEDGRLQWSTGHRLMWKRALAQPPMKPGDLWGMTNILGFAGGFTGVSTYFGGYHLFTQDGIYVAMVMRPGSAPGGMGHDITASETITGQLVQPRGSDKIYLVAGDQDGRVTELRGLDSVQKLPEVPFEITAAQAEAVARARQEYEAAQQRQGLLYIQRPPHALGQDLAPIERTIDEGRAFQAQLAWDDEYLHLQYAVRSPAPLVNAIEDPTLFFKGGNLMDVQLATDPQADPKREKPAPGDVRLLVSRRPDGAPVAVLLRPKVAGFEGDAITLESPTGNESFDRIEVLDGVSVEVGPLVRQDKRRKITAENWFLATAKVPLAALGWKPFSGQVLRADLGYIFGNQTGNDAALRAYWHNNSFTANVVDDVPHESRLEPHRWGTAVVE